MEIKVETHDVSTAGLLERRKYGVDAGAAMFALTNLYRNPIDAIVREYATNMYDAWLALKRERPDATFKAPEIVLPGPLDSSIVFRDYGIGMSVDTVWNKFMWFGGTTKNLSNDEVGGFGLGCKTANCYNGGSAWTIESRYDGELHSFMCFLAEDGSPDGAHVSTVPTTERNGITVTIPIRREDHQKVRDAVAKYLPFFPTDVKLVGGTFDRPAYVLKGNGWGIRATVKNYHNSDITNIVMGNVPYPLPISEMESFGIVRPTGIDRDAWGRFLGQTPIDLTVPIGSIDIVPSRDNMRNTDKTKAAVKYAWDAMMDDLVKQFSKELDKAPTAWDAIKMYDELTNKSGTGKILPAVIYKGTRYEGRAIRVTLKELLAADPTATVTRYTITNSDIATPEVADLTKLDDVMWVRPQRGNEWDHRVLLPNESLLMIDDLGARGGVAAARAAVHNAFVSKTANGRARRYGHTVGQVYAITTKLTADELSVLFGGCPSNIVLTASVVRGTMKAVPGAKVAVVENIYRWGGSWGARVNIPDDGTARYYVTLTKNNAGKWVYRDKAYSQAEEMRSVARAMEVMKLDKDTPIYGCRPDDVKNLPTSWVNLETLAVKMFTDFVTTNATAIARSRQKVSDEVTALATLVYHISSDKTSGMGGRYSSVSAAANLHGMPSDLVDFYNAYCVGHSAETSKIVATTDLYGGLVDKDIRAARINVAVKDEKMPNLSKTYIALASKYPMLPVLASLNHNSYNSISSNNHHKKITLDYIATLA